MTIAGYYIPSAYQNRINLDSNETTMNANSGNFDKNQVKTHIKQQIQQRIEDEKDIKLQISQLTNIGRILNITV